MVKTCAWLLLLQYDNERYFDDETSTLMCKDTVLLDMMVSDKIMYSDTPAGLF